MKALLLVDVQNDFMPGGALAVPNGDAILAPINRLQKFIPRIIATQDWHPANHGSFAANHSGANVGETRNVHGIEQHLWPVHCVQESNGAALHSGLEQLRIERVFKKGVDATIDSYSGFFDVAERRSTGLVEYLRAEGITELYIAGLATEICLKATVLDAVRCGFKTTVVTDGCGGLEFAPGDCKKAFAEMADAGARLLSHLEIEQECLAETGKCIFSGKFLRIADKGGWEYAERTNCTAVVLLVAVHEGNLLLTEQFRVPMGRTVLELPAGLAGDSEEFMGEKLDSAARRELIEEIGYDARKISLITTGPSSAGSSNETLHIFLAQDLIQVSDGGGVDGERIVLHRVPLTSAWQWLRNAEASGHLIDPKVFAGLYFLSVQGNE